MTAPAASKVEALLVVKGIGAVMALALPGYTSGPLGTWALMSGGLLVTAVAVAALLRRTAGRIDRG
ncbi:hypothetical protein [Nocardiopsis algeriensis]|uniref:Uncharacterized protein n=1 Tax=Nocardiopsis algeriensis TaxID=1478215 RepID=A0A841ISY0_9ACTN|nr:hypothetical protein [Nocardiopsis algeriensis]MBB6121330.1 hypothetical protein [Nocardiopsis algeriensis]